MKIVDLTIGVSPAIPVWPNNPGVELERMNKIEAGANSNVSRLAMGVHTGTHVDAPVHFIQGAAGVDTLRLETLVGPAYVLHLPKVNRVTAPDLAAAKIPPRTKRLLIKTRNSAYWARGDAEFHSDFVGVGPDAAEWLVKRKLQLVGVDYLSVAPWKESRPTHEILLKAGVVIVEGLNLSAVRPGTYDFVCLPLKLIGCDGAPARAVVVK
ncbi:MAG TPA: cyclase family protein [Anaerolineales bacterium]|nr:cyclase family protein [Anaerolineales bacterium]